jgi:hypothetical protein
MATPFELARLNIRYSPGRPPGFGIEEGRENLALSLAFWREHAWVCIDTEPDAPEIATPNYTPLFLFRVSDPRVPSIWLVDPDESGDVAIGPPAFHAPHYIEDVWDRNPPTIRDDYWRVVEQLRHEDAQP